MTNHQYWKGTFIRQATWLCVEALNCSNFQALQGLMTTRSLASMYVDNQLNCAGSRIEIPKCGVLSSSKLLMGLLLANSRLLLCVRTRDVRKCSTLGYSSINFVEARWVFINQDFYTSISKEVGSPVAEYRILSVRTGACSTPSNILATSNPMMDYLPYDYTELFQMCVVLQ